MTHFSRIVLAVTVIASIIGGIFLITRPQPAGGMDVILPEATATPVIEVGVYLTGAVRNPGVYTMSEGDRLVHIIQAAGGATEQADLTAVNLAVRLRDEDHWHIPIRGEAPTAAPGDTSLVRNASRSARININNADAELLQNLPGIGEVKAQAIISFRDTNGPFPSVESLLDVPGIGPATLEAIRELVEAR